MAKKTTAYEMTLKGFLTRVEHAGYVTVWDDLEDTSEEIIQISSLRDARLVESLSDVMGLRYSFRVTQGEIWNTNPVTAEEAWKNGQRGRYC